MGRYALLLTGKLAEFPGTHAVELPQIILTMLRNLFFLGFAAAVVSSNLHAAESKRANSPTSKPAAAKPLRKDGTKWDLMEHGPFLSSHMDATPKINKAVSINLGNGATVCFDTEMCKLALGWTGGFVKLPVGRDGLEGMPKPGGTNILFTTPSGPGWADGDGNFSDGRPEFKGRKYGPLPREHAKWKGIYLDGNTTVLSYTVGKASVLETHAFTNGVFVRELKVSSSRRPLTALICEAKGGAVVNGGAARIPQGAHELIVHVLGTGGELAYGSNNSVVLKVEGNAHVAVRYERVSREVAQEGFAVSHRFSPVFATVDKGGAPRWGEPLAAPGKVGTNDEAYVVDTLSVPETNPYGSWIRCSGLDFFSDASRAAVCSVSGDVWILQNIDDKLDRVTWKRFATGLFQPLGLKIVDDKVYVLGRDQITRLHDLNRDGEADFYENFNNDIAAFQDYHEFALDLQMDSKGNFYFAKGGNLGDARHPAQWLCDQGEQGRLETGSHRQWSARAERHGHGAQRRNIRQ